MARQTLASSERLPWVEQQLAAEGFALVCMEDGAERQTSRCLVHTIGLCRKGLPEVILEGVGLEQAVELVGNVAAWMVANDLGSMDVGKLQLSIPEMEIEVFLMWLQPAVGARKAPTACMLGAGQQFVQMCLRDESGRWPWDAAFVGSNEHQDSVVLAVGPAKSH